MSVLSGLALAGGLASMAFGATQDASAQKNASAALQTQQQGYTIEEQAATQQANISKAQAAASVQFASQQQSINVAAAQESSSVATQSQQINQQIIQNEQSIASIQNQAYVTQANRASIQAIRDQQTTRAMALATGVAQGGSGFVAGSSARGGAYGQASGQAGTTMTGITEGLQATEDIYGLNQGINTQQLAMNNLQTQYAISQAQTQTANANLAYSYAQSQAGFQTQMADTQTLMAQGQGLVNQGSGQLQAAQMQMQEGNSFLSAGPQIFSAGTNIGQLTQGLSLGTGLSSLGSFNNLFSTNTFNPLNTTGSLY